MNILENLLQAQQSGAAAVLATVIEVKGSAPRQVGAKMIVYESGAIQGTIGGGAVEKSVIEKCAQVLQQKQAEIVEYQLEELKMSCGGVMKLFLEPFFPAQTCIIFGAGHIGSALAKIVHLMHFRVIMVDDRPEFAAKENFPFADKVVNLNYDQALAALSFTTDTYIVIVTYRHQHDQTILSHCIRQPFRYLGMIGSKTKVQESINILLQQGVAADLISRIHSPIGLNINAQTPEEIAVSIAAEMVAVRNHADLQNLALTIAHD
ncbi:MAG: XdhC family protein [Calditrichaeota bacterium]|nr:MAG: XdhC family protein [Calditrichota bacterium]